MNVINLPDDILSNKVELNSPIIIYPYSSKINRFREKSVLHQNAVSLVISGQKTIRFVEIAVNTNDQEIHFLSAGNSIASFDITKYQEFESILIFFNNKELTDFSVSNATLIDEIKRKYNPVPSRYISFEKDDFIRTYITSMHLIVARSRPLSLEMKRIKLWELLLYLLENRSQPFLSFLYRGNALQNEMTIRKVVESNITENLTLGEMAFLCNVSTSTFKRQFGKIYNASPTTWFLQQKMQIAAQLLTQHNEKPGEIWFKLGFETHTGFTKAFKKHFGISPKVYGTSLS
ncbi:helix-turn-helix transcriptional regulator [Rhodocytophaga rosea]|uniref:Helix-turn-helix transcriptional regulator n=1 Tax=Rhodocytophaga rosea TaxID=2704465 RepID=A0A6C0GF24_9BACT|nr:AraC family transcriptional regulator [Rhodocytophaga rosea]QHT66363.1 helix-turn-helix transcriptional regulator [Rhodocytophaga rosea]